MSMRKQIAMALALVVLFAGAISASACDQTIILTNWKSCAVGTLVAGDEISQWAAVPKWARDEKIRPFFFDDPRLLAKHGLCNGKFHRVVLCLPGWQEAGDKNACWYLICSGHQAYQ